MQKVIQILVITFALVSVNAHAMKHNFKAQVTNNKKAIYAVTIITNHGPAHEVLRPGTTVNKHAKEIILRGEGAEYKLSFNDNGSADLFSIAKGKSTKLASVNSHLVTVVLDGSGIKLAHAQASHEAKAADKVSSASNANPHQSNANSNNAPASPTPALPDITFTGPVVMQGTKVQVTSQVQTPYTIFSRSANARYNDPIKRGQTIHKENISELIFSGDGAQHKLVFNNNGSTDLVTQNNAKVGSVDSHNVVVVISPNGLRLQKQAVLVKEFIPGTGVGVWKGSIVHGDINI